MARKISGYRPGSVREYIPRAYGNRADPEPVAIDIRYPSEGDKREMQGDDEVARSSIADGKVRVDDTGSPMIEVDVGPMTKRNHRVVERCVVAVRNYTAAGGEPITNGRELAAHGELEIITEVVREIMESLSLTESEAKKSAASSGSTPAGTQASSGVAESVSETGSRLIETVEAVPATLFM